MGFVDKALACVGDIARNRTNLDLLESGMDKLVPFVGAGLSMQFGYPGWAHFLQGVGDRLGLRQEVDVYIASGKFEEAADLLESSLPTAFNDEICYVFSEARSNAAISSGAVRHLPQIAEGIVITTNFDHVLESAFEAAGRPFKNVFPGLRIQNANRAIQLKERVLLKLHGDYDDCESRVLTLKEYARTYGSRLPGKVNANRPLPQVFIQALGSGPLLFLGCSLLKDRTTLVMAHVARKQPGILHFALLSSSENTKDRVSHFD